MAWTEKLKGLISAHLPQLKSLVNVTININCNNQTNKYVYNPEQKILDVDLNQLTPTEKLQFREMMKEAQEEGQILLETKSAELVQDFKIKNASLDIKQQLDFLQQVVPLKDFRIWRAALYIRARFFERKDITFLKDDIVRKYGQKGKNITNLCTAGYVDSLLKPNYDFLKEHLRVEEDLKKQFEMLYELVVYQLTVTVFVHSMMRKEEIKTEILNKIAQNFKYGIKFLNIHGLGQENLKKINEVVLELEADEEITPKITNVAVRQEKYITFIRLGF